MQGLSLPAPEQFSGRLGSLPLRMAGRGKPCTRATGEEVLRSAVREQSSSDQPGISRRVADMPEAASTRPRSPLTLNSDGQPHPLENSLAVFTLVTGLVVFAIGWVIPLHAIASVLGIVSML